MKSIFLNDNNRNNHSNRVDIRRKNTNITRNRDGT